MGAYDTKVLKTLNNGHIALFKALWNAKGSDFIKSIGTDGSKRPSEFNKNADTTLFSKGVNTKLSDALSKFSLASLNAIGTEINNKLIVSTAIGSNNTSSIVTINYLEHETKISLEGFRNEKQLLPQEAVDSVKEKLNKEFQAKDDLVWQEPSIYNLLWFKSQIKEEIDIDKKIATVVIDKLVFDSSSETTKVSFTVTSVEDNSFSTKGEARIKGYITQEDLDVKYISEKQITDVMKTKIIDMKIKDSDKDTTDFNDIDIIVNSRKYRITLMKGVVSRSAGTINFKYNFKKNFTETGYSNKNITADTELKTLTLKGFKTYRTDAMRQKEAMDFLNSLPFVTIPNVSSKTVYDPTTNIQEAIDAFMSKVVDNIPEGTPKYEITSYDEDQGAISIKVTYTYGNLKASKIIVFKGYQNKGDSQRANIEKAMKEMREKFNTTENKVSVPIVYSGSQPNVEYVHNQIDNLNSLLSSEHKLPTEVPQNIERYISFNDVSYTEGTVTLDIVFTASSLQFETFVFTIKLTGFLTQYNILKKLLDDDLAKFKTLKFEAKKNAINILTKGKVYERDINSIITEQIPRTEYSLFGDLWREYVVTSESYATTLKVEVTISFLFDKIDTRQFLHDKRLKRVFTFEIDGLQSEADSNLPSLEKELRNKLKLKLDINEQKKPSDITTLPETIGVIIRHSYFIVTLLELKVDDVKGEISFRYKVKANGLHHVADKTMTISGFKKS